LVSEFDLGRVINQLMDGVQAYPRSQTLFGNALNVKLCLLAGKASMPLS